VACRVPMRRVAVHAANNGMRPGDGQSNDANRHDSPLQSQPSSEQVVQTSAGTA
jgi:hypothetical protein